MAESILKRLRAEGAFMRPVEARIAKLILADPASFCTLSLGAAARMADASQGSLVNFANKYAHGGFPALKLAVTAAYAAEGIPMAEDSMGAVLRKTVKGAEEAFHNTLSLNNEDTLRRVAERVRKAKKVEIYGIFRSAVVATDFYYQLLQLGVPATFVSDVLTCAASASLLRRGSLVIAISSSGQTKDVLDAVSLAKENGVPVVGITANGDSPLARLSDDVLIAAHSGRSDTVDNTEVRLSQLALTDAICSYLRDRLDAESKQSYSNMTEILNSHSVKD
ncbi:MAG: MurR/RpiR family transcriptional regulator [Clostridia bacterium]|nr:MurR/RpiR family transcriptional regulator [Clostridia bacterium]